MSVVPANTGGLQWWRVCLAHGDQTKFYRQLYGHKRAAIRTQLQNDAKKISTAVDTASAATDGGHCVCGASAADIAPG